MGQSLCSGGLGGLGGCNQLELVHEVKMASEEPWAVRKRAGGGMS